MIILEPTWWRKLLAVPLLFFLTGCVRQAQISTIPTPLPVQTRLPVVTSASAGTSVSPSSPVETDMVPATALPEGQPTPLPYTLAVFSLVSPDVLNVRSEPGVDSAILEFLPADERGIKPTGRTQQADGWLWTEIERPSGVTGWAASEFLVEEIDPAVMCADSRLNSLLDQFIQAVRKRDGTALSSVISPLHGLRIHLQQDVEGVVITGPLELGSLFDSDAVYDWGAHPVSGESLIGTFAEKVLPSLLDVVGTDPKRICNTLQQGLSYGNTSETISWPEFYGSLNYMALFRPAPLGDELNWRTWAIGIDYVNGKPYVSVLIQYYWTP